MGIKIVEKQLSKQNDIKIQNDNIVPKVRYNREHLLSKPVATELNTYLNFGVFPTYADTYDPDFEKKGDQYQEKDARIGTPGVRSIFNRAGAIIIGTKGSNVNYYTDITDGSTVHDWRIANNVPLMDSPKARQRIREFSGCTVKELVNASESGLMGQETYAYSDFMYCKHLGRVSNNYMITLRRFPLPVDDFIGADMIQEQDRLALSSHNASSIGCMVTWMGVSGNEMSNILNYSFHMPFQEQTAEEQQNQADADQQTSTLNGIFSMFDQTYQKQYQEGYAGVAVNELLGNKLFGVPLGNPPYTNMKTYRDQAKIYGPVDGIKTTYMRSNAGLSFSQSFELVFEYELRSYNGINGRQAMLDLISNILNVTYTTGTFWGGGYKYYGAHQSNIFTNLNVFKARGGATEFISAFWKDAQNIGGNIKGAIGGGDLKSTVKNLLSQFNNIGGMLMAGMLNKLGRPQKTFYNSLLSPAPIGFWHVTIGNPKHPIMSIGNMVVTDTKIEHMGPLGLDDFPTGLRVKVSLTRGKPRDLRDIERLYMQGNNRIYTSMSDKVFDMYKNSQLWKTNKPTKGMYQPVSNIAKINTEDDKVTISVDDYGRLKKTMRKYFGTDDTYSIYIPAAEQECGAHKKKPSTAANKNVTE